MQRAHEGPLLHVDGLRVSFGDHHERREAVKGVTFTIDAGECLAIVGESGSGKSVTARTLVGLTGPGSVVRADELKFNGKDLLGLRDRQWRAIRGQDIGFILQDALVSLDPLRPVGKEIEEAMRVHGWGTAEQRRTRVRELLTLVGMPEPELRARQRAPELSGGLRQRALIASALALDPPLLIADEPTTALDATVQAQILNVLDSIKRRGTALVLISHDLAVVSRLADTVAVMNGGQFVEYGDAREVFGNPSHKYTQALIDAVPSRRSRRTRPSQAERGAQLSVTEPRLETDEPLLEARGLVKNFRGPGGVQYRAVNDVSFTMSQGETVGIVGESGSGKTTTARMVLGLAQPDVGHVYLSGDPWSEISERVRRARRREIAAIYQDPFSSFDPRWSVEQILTDALSQAEYQTPAERHRRVGELLDLVGLTSDHLRRRPLVLSGGQRQRVAIARALAPRPRVLVCDEPVSALDVLIQAQVLDLLKGLQVELGVSYLFISHNLEVIHSMSDRVLVMKGGEIVEHGDADSVLTKPVHPYTRELVASLPTLPESRSEPPGASK